jgi:hypothetical protein
MLLFFIEKCVICLTLDSETESMLTFWSQLSKDVEGPYHFHALLVFGIFILDRIMMLSLE